MSTVPFGKYKGRPVEQMLADADYMAWLEAQPWFRERFSHMTRRDNDSLSRTPEHNRLQALFLTLGYACSFSGFAAPKAWERQADGAAGQIESGIKHCDEEIVSCTEAADRNRARFPDNAARLDAEADSWREGKVTLGNSKPRHTVRAKFEHEGADVYLECVTYYPIVNSKNYHKPTVCQREDSFVLRVEIKPVVADDYPVVLRQMNRNKSDYLFLGSYEGEGATFAQFLQIFAASGKRVILKETVDRHVEGPSHEP